MRGYAPRGGASEWRTVTVRVRDFAGLWHRRPVLAGLMTIFLLSLVGIPPTFGFLGKAKLFLAGLEAANAAAGHRHRYLGSASTSRVQRSISRLRSALLPYLA